MDVADRGPGTQTLAGIRTAEADDTATPETALFSPLALLVAACQAGDQAAWAELIGAYSSVPWSVARSFRLRTADCEDVCQVTWLRVVENIHRLREPEKLASWLVTIARREAMKQLERDRRQVPIGDNSPFDAWPDAAAVVEETILDRSPDVRLMAAFRGLEKQHQALLAMLLREPAMSYDEISAALGIPRGSIGPTRNRLLRRLRESVQPQLALAG
ncbi:sigma-70 family RNA polymerase sigma factor [Micromonospora sp. WMMD882]|uniref:RNA polymerase sigma factor n=1 Tax=Micromonospora sp. WMMD882 TaxID=3015151 RepID=UPI00248AFDE8|nr:sigma-70 family RNA polymerase sigma factor [Micromonospora sp. WMMD882]WBB78430.1 sigma-70 family RNA polymerase sigma factor [Micromonospora sp. WMMD882]